MKNRILSLLIILVLTMSIFPVSAEVVSYDAYSVIDSLNCFENQTSENSNNLLEFKSAGQYAKYYVDFGDGGETIGCVVRSCFAANYEGILQFIIDGAVVGEVRGHNNGSWNWNYKTRHFYIENTENLKGVKTVELRALGGFGAFKSMQFFTDASTLDIGDPIYLDAYSEFAKKHSFNTTEVKKYNLNFGEHSDKLALRLYREYYTTEVSSSEITLKVGNEVIGHAPSYYVTADNGNKHKATYIIIEKPELLNGDVYLEIQEKGTQPGSYSMWFVKTANPYENMLSAPTSEDFTIKSAVFGDKTVESIEVTYTSGGSFDAYYNGSNWIEGFALPATTKETTIVIPVKAAEKYTGVIDLSFDVYNGTNVSGVKFNYNDGPAKPVPNFNVLTTEFKADNVTHKQGVTLGDCITDTNVADSYVKWEAVDFGDDERSLDVSVEYATTKEFSGGLITLYVDEIKDENIIAQIVAENRYGIDWNNTKVEMIPITKFPTGVRDLYMTVTPSEYAATNSVDTDIYKIDFLEDTNADEYRTYVKKISKYNTTKAKNEPVALETTLTFKNTNEELTNSAFIMAVYDKNMKLCGVDYVPINTVKGLNSAVAKVPYSVIGDSTSYTVKGFLWNGTNYAPVANEALDIIEISNDTFTSYPVEITTDLSQDKVSVICFGDSITMGQYVTPQTSYHDFWEESYNITSINKGVGGSTVTTASDASNWHSFIKRVGDLDTTADMVFVMGGTNDCIRSVSIGSIDDTGVTTFYGAYNSIIKTLKTNFPNKTIVLATPLYYSGINWSTNGSWGGSANVEKYGDAVKAIGKKYNLPVVDLQVDEMDFSTKGAGFMHDGLHPNYYCHSLIGDYILDELFEMGIFKEPDYDSLYGELLSTSDFDEPVVSDFYGNKEAGVSITFDDALYSSALYYNEAFKANDLCGTAMLIADELENETGETVEAWQTLFDEGYIEAGNHSKTHDIAYSTGAGTYTSEELVDDITGGYELLKECFPDEKLLTFASPWSQTTNEATAEVKKNHYANRLQGGLFDPNPENIDSLYSIPSYAVTSEDTAQTLNAKVDEAIAQNKWFVHLLHGALDTKPASKVYHIVKSEADEHFEYLASKEDKIWVATLGDMVAYIYEHKSSDIKYSWIRENAMSISITDGLDNDIFNLPLTVKIEVPSGWTTVKVTQGKNSSTIICSDGYAYIDAIPDAGNVFIEKM